MPLITACSDSIDDELAGDDATAGDAAKADEAGGTFTYYFVTPDLRKCAAPDCGGVFFRLANADLTSCPDGKKAESCYAANVDWTGAGLSEATLGTVHQAPTLLVRGTVGSKDWGKGIGTFAELRPSEAWLAQGPNEAAGPIAKIEDSGIRCITAPCPSLRERKLNTTVQEDISELGWKESGATDSAIQIAMDRIYKDGLIVSGFRYMVGSTKARTVTQFWLRAVDEASPKQCFVGGWSANPPT